MSIITLCLELLLSSQPSEGAWDQAQKLLSLSEWKHYIHAVGFPPKSRLSRDGVVAVTIREEITDTVKHSPQRLTN